MALPMLPEIFSLPDMKAWAGFSWPENILLKLSDDMLRVASAAAGDLPCPHDPDPFFRSRKYSVLVSVREKLNTESVFLTRSSLSTPLILLNTSSMGSAGPVL